jgi:hypothetical protein
VPVNAGGVLSDVQVTVRDAVDVLPQASAAVHVLVCVRVQPSLTTGLSLEVGGIIVVPGVGAVHPCPAANWRLNVKITPAPNRL